MQKILEEIKSVQGVTGVLVWNKKTLSSSQILPANFAFGMIKSTCQKMANLAQALGVFAKAELFYANGIAIFLDQPSTLILILGRTNLDSRLLDLVLNSCLARLEKLLSFKRLEGDDFPVLEQKKMDRLLEGMNLISSYISDRIGAYRTTQNLRQAKDKLIASHSFMANLFVDNNARLSIIKGKQGLWSGEVILAFAKWVAYTEKLCFKKEKAIDLKKITSPIEQDLDEMGFYFAFHNIRGNI